MPGALLDDEVDFVQAVSRRLKGQKRSAGTVHSGEDALRHLAENPTDVVVLDMKIPGMDGTEAFREIKARQPFVEVIMLAGLDGVAKGSTETAL